MTTQALRKATDFNPSLEEPKQYFTLSGLFVMGDIIEPFAKRIGKCKLTISTLSLNISDMQNILSAVHSGAISEARIIISEESFTTDTKKKTFFKSVELLKLTTPKVTISSYPIHSKVMIFECENGDTYHFFGSANTRASDSIENILLSKNDNEMVTKDMKLFEKIIKGHTAKLQTISEERGQYKITARGVRTKREKSFDELEEYAKEIRDQMRNNETSYIHLDGSFEFLHLFKHLTRKLLPKDDESAKAKLTLSTYSLGMESFEDIMLLERWGHIEEFKMVVSGGWASQNKRIFNQLKKDVGQMGIKSSLGVIDNHTKIFIIEIGEEAWHIIASANLRSIGVVESLYITKDKELIKHDTKWIDNVIERYAQTNTPIRSREARACIGINS